MRNSHNNSAVAEQTRVILGVSRNSRAILDKENCQRGSTFKTHPVDYSDR